MKWSKLSHVGLVRDKNEDNSCICDDIPLLAVADGMGGHRAGEIASKLALEALASYLRQNPGVLRDNPAEALKEAFAYANSMVYHYAREEGDKFRGMGTTVTALLPRGDMVLIAHIGDSRAYLIRAGQIRQLTTDHSLVGELVRNGGLTEEEAENHPQRNILTRAIGTSAAVEAEVDMEPVEPGDLVVLCTDGLSNFVGPDEIRQAAGGPEPLAEKAQHLIARALARGGDDNITVILFEVEQVIPGRFNGAARPG